MTIETDRMSTGTSLATASIAPTVWQTERADVMGSRPSVRQVPPDRSVARVAVGAGRPARLSKKDLANLTSQLSIMLRSGVDVATALESLARQSKRSEQQAVLRAIHADVLGGQSFSAALGQYCHLFGVSYVATVAAGESSGKMADVLSHLAVLQRSELRLRSSIRTLMAYPLLLLSISGLVTVALVLFVLPKFAEVFAQFDTPLPLITQVLLSISTELRGRVWFWGPAIIGSVGAVVVFAMSEPGRRVWYHFLLHTYVIRHISQALLIGHVCRLLGLMIESGVPLLDGLRIVRSSIKNTLYRGLLASVEQSVLNGRGLGKTLIESAFVPPAAAEMLLTAEQTGELGNVTQMIGEHFEEEGQVKLRDLVAFVEPVITIGMGVVVAIVVLAVMLPMFDMATFAQG